MQPEYPIPPGPHQQVLIDWYNRGANSTQLSALMHIMQTGGTLPDIASAQSYYGNNYGAQDIRPANDPNARPSLYIPGIDNVAGTPPKPKPKPPPDGRPRDPTKPPPAPPRDPNGPPPSINPANNAMLSGPNPIITSPFRHLFTQGQIDSYGLHTPMVISNIDAAGKIHSRDYNWWDPNAVLNTLVKPPPKDKGKK